MYVRNSSSSDFLFNRSKKTSSKLQKALEKLSSGFDVNRAADDAASLAVSEKMRAIIAGLDQGVDNVNDGISYIHSVDGASQHIHNILNRLTTLANQASNGIYDVVDREAIDLEYQDLLDEIDQMTDTMDFNGIPLFEKHMEAYGMAEGNVIHTDPIEINSKNDMLVFGYSVDGVPSQCTIKIPHGTYSPAEVLADIIDTELYDTAPNLIIGVDENEQFTIQVEPGKLDYIGGSGSVLFFEGKLGSETGNLLGVTEFLSETARMYVKTGENDVMQFRLGTEDTLYSVTLTEGYYTHQELIDHINQKFSEAGISDTVKAVPEINEAKNRIIALSSTKAVTGLSGNFLKMDRYHSPIYDICNYGYKDNTPAVLSAAKVLDGVNGVEIVRGRNEFFNLSVYDYESGQNIKGTIKLLDDGENEKVYAVTDLVDRINEQMDALGMPAEAELVGYKLKITSEQFGDKCEITLDKSNVPSEYMIYDLFDAGKLSKLTPNTTKSSFSPAAVTAYRQLSFPVPIRNGANELQFTVEKTDGTKTVVDISIPEYSYTKDALLQTLNDALADDYPDLKISFSINSSNCLSLTADRTAEDIKKITVNSDINVSTAYHKLLKGVKYSGTSNAKIENGGETSIYGGTAPNGSQINFTTAGTTYDAVTYKDETSRTSSQSGKYLNYSRTGYSLTAGDTREAGGGESQVGDFIDSPAAMTISGIKTQFTAAGKSLEDARVAFSLDVKGSKKNFDFTVPKGSTAEQALQIINDKLVLSGVRYATAAYSGNDLVITSVPKGDGVDFSAPTGTLCRSASVNSSLLNNKRAVADIENNSIKVPPTLTIPNLKSNIPMTVDSSNNSFIFSNGNKVYNLTLTDGTYSSVQAVADELNRLIAAEDNGSPETTVEVSGKGIVIVGSIGSAGRSMSIDNTSTSKLAKTRVDTGGASSPYYDPSDGKVKTPASLRLSEIATHFPLTVDSTNNKMVIDYSIPNGSGGKISDSMEIIIPDGTYSSPAELADIINNSPANKDANGDNILKAAYNASGSSKGLTISTVKGGEEASVKKVSGNSNLQKYKLSQDKVSGDGVISGDKLLTPATLKNTAFSTLASASIPLDIDDTNSHVSIKINNTQYDIDIAEGRYTSPQSLFDAFNAAIKNSPAKDAVEASYSNGTLTLKSKVTGSSSKFEILSGTTAPVFKSASPYNNPTASTAVDKRCSIVGQNKITSIQINAWDNEMTFDYSDVSSTGITVSGAVDVSVPAGTYTADTLIAAIQASIDAKLNPGQLTVYKTSSGAIAIKGAEPSNTRTISNFSGRLFDKVFQKASYTNKTAHTEKDGTSLGSRLSYIVGRNDLEPKEAAELESGKNLTIFSGVNDMVVFDFTYNGVTKKIEFTLPDGDYTKQELADAVEQGGRKAMAALVDENGQPFPSDFFNASIGLSELGVSENNTGISSAGKLVLWCKLPDDGTHDDISCIIDGVRGSSAYRIFYDASQSPSPTTIKGKADLSDGVIINSQNDELIFDLDGKEVQLKIPSGTYDTDSMSAKLNEMMEFENIKVRTINRDGSLLFYSTDNGEYIIDKFRGSAANDVFYDGTGRESDEEILIHYGRRTDSYIEYKKTRVDDHLMRINTTGITTVERAQKALNRLESANSYLSGWRALSGANENRSVHVLNRNNVYIENLTAADSQLRDTDIAQRTAEFMKNQILTQVQQSMYANVNEHQRSVLNVIT